MTTAGGDTRHFETREEFEAFREKVHSPYRWTFGEWRFDWLDGVVQPGGIVITRRQATILRVLCDSAGTCVTAADLTTLVSKIDGRRMGTDDVKTHINRLRGRIGEDRIETIHGRGYRFVAFPDGGQIEQAR